MKNSHTWIQVGYQLFSEEGHEGLRVERLARILNLNKSGFYHYFGTTDIYFQHLIVHHHEMIDLLCKDIGSIQAFDPDYLNVMVRHRNTIMATMQLTRNRHIKIFESALKDANSKIDGALLPLWYAYVGITDHPALALRYHALVRDAFYARITFEELHLPFLQNYFSEAKTLVEEMAALEDSLRVPVLHNRI